MLTVWYWQQYRENRLTALCKTDRENPFSIIISMRKFFYCFCFAVVIILATSPVARVDVLDAEVQYQHGLNMTEAGLTTREKLLDFLERDFNIDGNIYPVPPSELSLLQLSEAPSQALYTTIEGVEPQSSSLAALTRKTFPLLPPSKKHRFSDSEVQYRLNAWLTTGTIGTKKVFKKLGIERIIHVGIIISKDQALARYKKMYGKSPHLFLPDLSTLFSDNDIKHLCSEGKQRSLIVTSEVTRFRNLYLESTERLGKSSLDRKSPFRCLIALSDDFFKGFRLSRSPSIQ